MKPFYLVWFFIVMGWSYELGSDLVLTLDTENFDSILAQSDFLVVKFSGPLCKHCKPLASEYAKVAQEIIQMAPNVKFGQVDLAKDRELGKKYKIQAFPTIIIIIKGKKDPLQYKGDWTAEPILKWVQRRIA